MARLRWAPAAYLRRIQASTIPFWVFVEGELDFAYADRAMRLTGNTETDRYNVVKSAELREGTSGKQILLAMYRYIRRRRQLRTTLGSSPKTILFNLDKDVDDLKRKRVKSPHVIYSIGYNIESDLMAYGDLLEAASTTTGCSYSKLAERIGKYDVWRIGVAAHLSDWLALCVFVSRGRVHPAPGNFGVEFPLALDQPFGVLHADKMAALWMSAKQNAKLPEHTVDLHCQRCREHIAKLISRNRIEHLLNGRWLAEYLRYECSLLKAQNFKRNKKQTEQLFRALVLTLTPNSENVRRLGTALITASAPQQP